ncbi:MAG: hypothetical protein LLG44_07865 [Chloroflexi bacterium]|nr:hypothetical protein [Chloroflexota bacterium]
MAGRTGKGSELVTILWLFLLPLFGAVLVIGVRRWPIVVVSITAAILLAMVTLAAGITHTEYSFLLGRLIELSPSLGSILAYCYLLMAILALASFRSVYPTLNYAFMLLFISLVTATLATEDGTLGALLFSASAIVLVLGIVSSSSDKSLASLRVLSVIVLIGPLLLLAVWALEHRALDPNNISLMRLGAVSLILVIILGLGLLPLGFWLPSIYKKGNPIAIISSFILQLVLVVRLRDILYLNMWPDGQAAVAGVTVIIATITVVGAGILVVFQSDVGGILAYTAIADMGVLTIGLCLGTSESTQVSLLHFAYRGLALAGGSIGLGIIKTSSGSDALSAIRGGWHNNRLAVLGTLMCGLSLVGMPLTAGFTTKLSTLSAMGTNRTANIIAITAASLGPALAWGRFALATQGSQERVAAPSQVIASIFCCIFGVVLVVCGVYPRLLTLIVPDFIEKLASISQLLLW